MSFSAMPAFFRAAMTMVMRSLLAARAAAAVGASVMTPRLMVALSGATWVSP